MRLGVSAAFAHKDPENWAEQMREIGAGTVVFPLNFRAEEEKIEAYVQSARRAGLTIAEVGIWKNTLAADPAERMEAREYAVGQLRLADRIGARCCVNVAGTAYGPVWDGGYRGNFSREAWDETVRMIRDIIDEAAPVRTKFCIEPMPWMIPTGPEEYLRLLEEVDRPQFGVHMDLVNMVNCPQRYFFLEDFMETCFEKLHGRIVSCHLKDIVLLEDLTFQLRETACGSGIIPLERYAELASREDADMPMIIEHLQTEEEYRASMHYVRERLDGAHGIAYDK